MTKTLTRSRSLRTKFSGKGHADDSAVYISTVTTTTTTTTSADYTPKHELRSVKSSITAASKADSFFDDLPNMPQAPTQYIAGPVRKPVAHSKSIPIVLPPEAQSFAFDLPPSKPMVYAEVVEDKPIGVALGSPTHPPQWSPPPPVPKDTVESGEVVTSVASPPRHEEEDASKHKPRRWKSIFGKKNGGNHAPSPLNPAYSRSQVESLNSTRSDSPSSKTNNSPRTSPRLTSEANFDGRNGRLKSRKPTSPGARDFKTSSSKPLPPIDGVTSRKNSPAEERSPPPPPKDYYKTARVPKLTVTRNAHNPLASHPVPGMLLDVDIPNIEMERYSVMFGSLLQGDRSSSLLVRRQANNDRLKPLGDMPLKAGESANPGWPIKTRRATSPSFNSPKLTLFPPSTPRDARAMAARQQEPRPLLRSNTSPAALSPNRMNFPRNVVETPPKSNFSGSFPFTTPSPSAQSFDDEEIYRTMTHSSRPWEDEPSWEMVTKTTPHSQRGAVLQKKQKAGPKNVPQVAIARKVSLTRMRKDMLSPQLRSPERLVNKMPLTPTVVELGNRASHRVQIEDA